MSLIKGFSCRKTAICNGDQLLDFSYRNSFGANQRLALTWTSFRIAQVSHSSAGPAVGNVLQ